MDPRVLGNLACAALWLTLEWALWGPGSLLHPDDASLPERRGFEGACVERLVVRPKSRCALGARAVFRQIPAQLSQCLQVLHLQKCTLQAAALANLRSLSRLEMRDCTIYGNPAPWQRAYPVLGSGSRTLRSFALHNCIFDMGTGMDFLPLPDPMCPCPPP